MEYPEFLKFQNVRCFVPYKGRAVFLIAQGTKSDTFGKNQTKLDTFGHLTFSLFEEDNQKCHKLTFDT